MCNSTGKPSRTEAGEPGKSWNKIKLFASWLQDLNQGPMIPGVINTVTTKISADDAQHRM